MKLMQLDGNAEPDLVAGMMNGSRRLIRFLLRWTVLKGILM